MKKIFLMSIILFTAFSVNAKDYSWNWARGLHQVPKYEKKFSYDKELDVEQNFLRKSKPYIYVGMGYSFMDAKITNFDTNLDNKYITLFNETYEIRGTKFNDSDLNYSFGIGYDVNNEFIGRISFEILRTDIKRDFYDVAPSSADILHLLGSKVSNTSEKAGVVSRKTNAFVLNSYNDFELENSKIIPYFQAGIGLINVSNNLVLNNADAQAVETVAKLTGLNLSDIQTVVSLLGLGFAYDVGDTILFDVGYKFLFSYHSKIAKNSVLKNSDYNLQHNFMVGIRKYF